MANTSPSESPSFDLSSSTKTWMKVAMILAVIGLGISFYSTMHHLDLKANGSTSAACNINDTFSCDEVAKSKYSEFGGIPLGVFGLGYFFSLLVLSFIVFTNDKQRKAHLQTYAAMVIIGLFTSLTLGAISAFDLGTFCVTCIGIYTVNLLQAGALFAHRADTPTGGLGSNLVSGGTTALIATALVIGGFNFITPSSSPSESANTTDEHGHSVSAGAPVLLDKVAEIKIHKSAYSGLGEDYRAGSDTAKVQVVEFADFECPACSRMANIMKSIKTDYGNKILLVFKNYPLDQSCNPSITRAFHKSACTIAILSRCAGTFGKFWQYHDLAYASQKSASQANAKKWAKAIGLNDDQINTCLSDKSIVEKLRDDINVANQIGLTGTPTIYLNGRKYVGSKGESEIRAQIDRLLAE